MTPRGALAGGYSEIQRNKDFNSVQVLLLAAGTRCR